MEVVIKEIGKEVKRFKDVEEIEYVGGSGLEMKLGDGVLEIDLVGDVLMCGYKYELEGKKLVIDYED